MSETIRDRLRDQATSQVYWLCTLQLVHASWKQLLFLSRHG